MAPTVSVGDTIPEGTFKYVPHSKELDEHTACGIPINLSTNEWKGKKVVLFAVPGAFTPGCHVKHLPGYIENNAALKEKGVDVVAVLAVNDAYVMSGWLRFTGVKDEILGLSDKDAVWSAKLGLTNGLTGSDHKPVRYALVIDDLVLKYIGVEPKPGVSVSGADAVLAHL